MSQSRFLKLEILGCVLLLAATLGILFRAPKAPWEGTGREESPTNGGGIEAPRLEGDGTRSPGVRTEVPPIVAPPPKPKPPTKHVSGKLVVIDALGHESADRSGQLFMKVQVEGESAEVHRVAVRKGAFTLDAYEGCFLACDTATIDDDYAVVDLERTPIPNEGTLVVHAKIPPRTRLFVEDALTGASLERVTLRDDSRWHDSSAWDLEPGDLENKEIRVNTGASPREIPLDAAGQLYWWVDAPGYAPQRVRMATTNGGDYVVRLQRAASLTVTFTPSPSTDDLVLVIERDSDARTVGRRLLEKGRTEPVRFAAVDPGRYVLRVVSKSRSPLVLAESHTELMPGESKQTLLEFMPTSAPVLLRGTIRVPSSWPETMLFMVSSRESSDREWLAPVSKLFSDLSTIGSDSRERSFEIAMPRARLFRFEFDSTGIAFERTALECEQPLRFELPEAARVRFRLRTDDGGLFRGSANLSLHLRFGGVESSVIPDSEGANGDPTEVAMMPPGEITIESRQSALVFLDGSRRTKVVVTQGDNEIVLPVRVAKGSLLAQFGLHGAILSVSDSVLENTRVLRANGEELLGSVDAGGILIPIGVRETLEIVPPTIEGFQPAAPMSVDVDPTMAKRVVIELATKS